MRRLAIAVGLLALTGCGGAIKRRTEVDIPPAYRLAKTATLQELVQLINERYAGVNTLSISNLSVEFTGGSVEKGYLEKYPRAKAYFVARAPDAIFFNILNPLTNSTVATMAALEERFQIWVPRENKYVTGNVNVEVEEKDPLFSVRPHHLLQGLLVESLPAGSDRLRYFLEEAPDEQFKYYVIGVIDVGGGTGVVHLVRRLWIERSNLRLAQQRYYDDLGRLASIIRYGNPVEIDRLLVNSDIEIERGREDYRIRFELERGSIKVNQPIKEGAFEIPQPPGAEVVVVEEEAC